MNQNIEELIERYGTLDELFQTLPEDVRKHSIRVAEYARILYIASVEIELTPYEKGSEKEIRAIYGQCAFLAGRYHDIGLVALSPEAQDRTKRDTAAIESEYRTHAALGKEILSQFSDDRVDEKGWELIMEATLLHHEERDGSGFPEQRNYESIPFMATIVSMANFLDNESAYIHMEDPFARAGQLLKKKLSLVDRNELDLLRVVGETRLQKAFLAHRGETQAIVTPPQMIFRRPSRPLRLIYRRVDARKDGMPVLLQAQPSFYDADGQEEVSWDEMEETLQDEGMLFNTWRYFLYEVGDTLRRMSAYGFEKILVQLPVPQEVFEDKQFAPTVRRWKEETDALTRKIEFLINTDTVVYANNKGYFVVEDIADLGIRLSLVGYNGLIPLDYLNDEVNLAHITLDPAVLDHLDAVVTERLKEIILNNIVVIADGINSDEYNEQLDEIGITCVCGEIAGDFKSEDEILKDCNATYLKKKIER